MSEHTPGPWRVFTSPRGTKIIGIGTLDGDGITDCGFGVWRGGSDEAMANARLIAAAPDLLAACTEFLPILERQLDSINPGGAAEGSKAFACATERVERMRAAIAKAEGRA